MATFTGTDAWETITPAFVSPTVTADPAGSLPGDGDDRLFGNGGEDTLDGGAGDDLVNGGTGYDRLFGGAGNDTMQGGADGDDLTGGDGNDTIDGGAGGDFAEYQFAASRVVVNLAVTARQDTRGAGRDRLVNIENLVGSAFNDILTGDAGVNLLRGFNGDDTVDGGGGNDILTGDTGKDTLIGGDGDDLLIAGPGGADHLAGGTGNDTYSLFNASDVVTELAGEGTDTVATGYSYTLGDNVENLSLLGSAGQKGIGNDLANTMSGNGGRRILYGMGGDDSLTGDGVANDRLDGGAGADTMNGGGGDDLYIVDDAGDVAREASGGGIDTVEASVSYTLLDGMDILLLQGTGNLTGIGNALDNTIVGTVGNNDLRGAAGNDTLEGGAGDDFLRGGAGVDTASYASAASGVTVKLSVAAAQATGGAGSDTLSDIENLTGSAHDDSLSGNGLANLLMGGAGNDTLNGAAGADTMIGGAGDDLYVVDDAGDLVVDSKGVDTVQSSISYTLPANVENLTLTGPDNIDGTGNSANNRIDGNGGNNVLSGNNGNDQLYAGAGTDQLSGGVGDDRFYFEGNLDQSDVVTGGAGSDTLVLAGNYGNFVFLGTTMTEVEYIRLTAGFSYRLTTNDATVTDGTTLTVQADTLGAGDTLYFDGSAEGTAASRFIITGGAGSDTLAGGAGEDHLLGGNGNDLLIGYSGDDFLTGGHGADRLEFSAGNDTAVYGDVLDSTSTGYDTVAGFDGAADFFDLPTTVADIDPTIASGKLTDGNFNQDLAAAANAATLLADHAALFTPDKGAHAGETFLIVDANGLAGYQAREDFVFRLDNPSNIGSLSTDRFV